MSQNIREDVTFDSDGTDCHAWFFPPAAPSPFATADGVPVVVMAHGFGGTKDSGLEPFARRLADAGLAVLAFDYRGFGLSGGIPRQRVSMAGQIADYHAAADAAARQPGVDAGRVVLWGLSQSGGHVLLAAADRTDVAAVISAVPMVSGLAAGRHHLPHVGVFSMLRRSIDGIASAASSKFGGAPHMLPIVGRPGQQAALTSSGFYESYKAIAGPSWLNEVDASVSLELGSYRADKYVDRIDAPKLVQIADFDRGAPPHAAAKAAFKARAEVRHYPCDHFDIFAEVDPVTFERVVEHQIAFLTRHLADPAEPHEVEPARSMPR
ncbi:alpha/beta hydrolase [Gordonia sputi]